MPYTGPGRLRMGGPDPNEDGPPLPYDDDGPLPYDDELPLPYDGGPLPNDELPDGYGTGRGGPYPTGDSGDPVDLIGMAAIGRPTGFSDTGCA